MRINSWDKTDYRGAKTSSSYSSSDGARTTIHNNETGGGWCIHWHGSDGSDRIMHEGDSEKEPFTDCE